jgi:hypothetical protein
LPVIGWVIEPHDGKVTIIVRLGAVEREHFCLPGWHPYDDRGSPLAGWRMDFYYLPEAERHDKHQGSFEKYVLARQEEEERNPSAHQDDDDDGVRTYFVPSMSSLYVALTFPSTSRTLQPAAATRTEEKVAI